MTWYTPLHAYNMCMTPEISPHAEFENNHASHTTPPLFKGCQETCNIPIECPEHVNHGHCSQSQHAGVCCAVDTADLGQYRSCRQGAEDTWAGSFNDNRTGSSKPHPFCKVFRLMTTGGVGSGRAKTRNLFG